LIYDDRKQELQVEIDEIAAVRKQLRNSREVES
jgi:hypothetical protein